MRFCYADPPYLFCCAMYGHEHNPGGSRRFDGECWNFPSTHASLINHLVDNYDGFALSMSAPSSTTILPILPEHRVGIWVKPFASFKPNVNPGYCWEPVAFVGGRKLGRDVPTVRDFVSANITLQKGTPGAKPPAFCEWVLDFMGYDPKHDTFDDLFPGSGVFGRVRDQRIANAKRGQVLLELTP